MKTAVIDIETIADTATMERAGYVPEPGEFIPWPLHAIVCVSVLTVESARSGDLSFGLRSFSRTSMAERGIVASVERALDGARTVFSYNGRAFDVPVLMARAIIAQEPATNIGKLWSPARPTLHIDLLEEIKGRGPGIQLVHLCAAFGIPVKTGGDGGGVAALAAVGAWDEIEHYCEQDVVATWLLAQHWLCRDEPGYALEQWEKLGRWLTTAKLPNPRLALFCDKPERSGASNGGRLDTEQAYDASIVF
ncbi:MAG: ribonuclease H-like domain-containing protein [Allosphingosinicella sp.]|uniref:ribonuclease H-like domain-containing protein n=1 Tax=Allosphingosinicella sp. TaxID=2823234 RepID=UPI003920B2F3